MRNRRYNKHKKANNIDVISKINAVTSGQLAINNCWILGTEVLQKMEEREAMEGKKQEGIDCNQKIKKQQESNNFKQAYLKIIETMR
jgi:phosphopentomutase